MAALYRNVRQGHTCAQRAQPIQATLGDVPTAYKPVLWTRELVMQVLGRDLQPVSGEDQPWQATGVNRRPSIIEAGDLYIASAEKGEDKLRQQVPQMFRQGAVAAIVAGPTPAVQGWSPLYRVADSKAAMSKLGAYARARTKATVVGVTGSVGKTGVKDALLHVLSQSRPTFANYRNANCGWGLPETLSNLPADVGYAIFEMGMLGPGSVGPKSERVEPHVALITALAPAHMGYHGSMDSIAETKAEIVAGMKSGGTFVVPRDTQWFSILENKAKSSPQVGRVLTFGEHESADVRMLEAEIGATFSIVTADLLGRRVKFEIGLGGRHWVSNGLAIVATVLALDADVDVALGALRGLTPSFRRGERFRALIANTKKVVEIIDDTWNANPISVAAALEQLRMLRLAPRARRVVYLGDMLELGPEERQMHESLLDTIEQAAVDVVHTVGTLTRTLHEKLPSKIQGTHYPNAGAAAKAVPDALSDGDLVLVKGSNGIDMWRIVHALVPQRRFARSVPPHWSLADERSVRH